MCGYDGERVVKVYTEKVRDIVHHRCNLLESEQALLSSEVLGAYWTDVLVDIQAILEYDPEQVLIGLAENGCGTHIVFPGSSLRVRSAAKYSRCFIYAHIGAARVVSCEEAARIASEWA